MKRLSYRALAALLLAAILLGGVLFFCGQYAVNGGNWATFPGSPHGAETADITDRSGVILRTAEGYADRAALRAATLHLLGDAEGNIPRTVSETYASRLLGYNAVSGLHHAAGRREDLTLTVSAPVQEAAWKALKGRKGTVLVYNYLNGEILCAVTSPSFDPLSPPEEPENGIYVNRAFGADYTPGSIFKLVTAAAALETLPDAETRLFHCDGTCDIGGDTITCTGIHGDVDLRDALAHSCNCAFAQLACTLGRDVLEGYVRAWRITEPCTFDGITTAWGHFDLSEAGESDLAWSGIGQYTDLVNPCAYLQFVGTIAGGGVAAAPYLVRSGKVLERVTTMSPEAAAILAEDMAYNVQKIYGTGQFPNVRVCAKSGTAEVGEGLQPHATFVGFVQDEDYPLAFFAAVENGGSGSAVSAPIAGQVLRECVRVLDAEKNSEKK